jgi:hypothetical protein
MTDRSDGTPATNQRRRKAKVQGDGSGFPVRTLARTGQVVQVARKMGLGRTAKERSIMTRNGLIAVALACGLMPAAPLGPARAQSLTVPPDLRTPGQTTGPAAAEPDAPAAKKPKREKRAAQAKARSATAPKLSAPQSGGMGGAGKREYPADIDRSDDAGPSVKPSFSPSGRMGIGGRF